MTMIHEGTALRAESDQIAAARPDVIRRPSRRQQILTMAQHVADEPTDSPFFTAVADYVVKQSWLPDDIARLAFASLAKAWRGHDMPAVASLLNELCCDVGGAA